MPSLQIGRSDSQGSGTGAPAEVGYEPTSPTHASGSWNVSGGPRDDADAYRTWPQEPHAYPSIETGAASGVDPGLREASVQSPTAQTPSWTTSPIDTYANARYSMVPVAGAAQGAPQQTVPSQPAAPQPTALETSMYASASYAQQQHQQQQHQQAQAQAQAQAPYPHASGGAYPPAQETPPSTIPPLPRHTYTRTLVGPLSANACRLLDEHRKPGIFFLFQDLSIRTEGEYIACGPRGSHRRKLY